MEANHPLRILMVEDVPSDAELAERELRNSGFQFTSVRVDTKEGFLKALEEFQPDLIISDYAMPEFDGMQALMLSLEHDAKLPFIVLTGSMNEETAVTCMKAGAMDYVIKDRLARFPFAVREALEKKKGLLEKEAAEKALAESEKRYRTIMEEAADAVFIHDETGRILDVNWKACQSLGYSREELLSISIRDIDPEAIQTGKQELWGKVLAGEHFTFESRQMRKDGGSIPVEVTLGKVNLPLAPAVLGIVRDITDRKQTEDGLKDTLERLRKAVNTTIQVMVSAVETRDPYTAGHQRRVADIARAIAAEMGLSQEKIEGIRIAGTIHDIGKLSIPAEILSKPTKLSEIEFRLIKEHSRIGFEILKDVESSWPLAEIVYQHHERMDGSGYPRNLKGDNILIDARILSVADTVEAMASHRPYRPGLGIDAALEEIEKNRGALYDEVVTGACLGLFREKEYRLVEA